MEAQEVGGGKGPQVRAKDLLSNCQFARARSTVTALSFRRVSDKSAKFYIDGKRISRGRYADLLHAHRYNLGLGLAAAVINIYVANGGAAPTGSDIVTLRKALNADYNLRVGGCGGLSADGETRAENDFLTHISANDRCTHKHPCTPANAHAHADAHKCVEVVGKGGYEGECVDFRWERMHDERLRGMEAFVKEAARDARVPEWLVEGIYGVVRSLKVYRRTERAKDEEEQRQRDQWRRHAENDWWCTVGVDEARRARAHIDRRNENIEMFRRAEEREVERRDAEHRRWREKMAMEQRAFYQRLAERNNAAAEERVGRIIAWEELSKKELQRADAKARDEEELRVRVRRARIERQMAAFDERIQDHEEVIRLLAEEGEQRRKDKEEDERMAHQRYLLSKARLAEAGRRLAEALHAKRQSNIVDDDDGVHARSAATAAVEAVAVDAA